jgi:hypothetical protein
MIEGQLLLGCAWLPMYWNDVRRSTITMLPAPGPCCNAYPEHSTAARAELPDIHAWPPLAHEGQSNKLGSSRLPPVARPAHQSPAITVRTMCAVSYPVREKR